MSSLLRLAALAAVAAVLQPSPVAATDRCVSPRSAGPSWRPAQAWPVAGGGPVVTRGKVYIASAQAGTVAVFDAATNRFITAIPIGYRHGDMDMSYAPHNVQAAPDGRTIWATAPPAMLGGCEEGTDSVVMTMPLGMPEDVVVIDPVADTILARITLAVQPGDTMLHLAHIVLDRDSRYAYVSANAADQVIRIDARTLAEVGRYAIGGGRGPHGMRFCGDRLVVANVTGKSLSIIQPDAGLEREIPVGGMAVQVACTGDGRFVFASLYDTREVVRYELATGDLVRIALPAEARGPIQIYLRPDDRRLYVADQGVLMGRPANNKLYEIDVTTSRVTRSIRVGRAPHGVVVSDDGRWAYVTNLWDANVSVIDLDAWDEVSMVPSGNGPNGITFWNGVGTAVSASVP